MYTEFVGRCGWDFNKFTTISLIFLFQDYYRMKNHIIQLHRVKDENIIRVMNKYIKIVYLEIQC